MSRVIAFTKAFKEERILISKWLGLLGQECPLYNIPNHRIEDHIRPKLIVIAFGKAVSTFIEQYIREKNIVEVKLFTLPHPKFFKKIPENAIPRAEASKQLEEIKETLAFLTSKESIISTQDLPNLSIEEVLKICQTTPDFCLQTSQNGKIVQIGGDEKKANVDIHLSFNEIYTIKAVMDILNVKEVQLVANSNKDNSPDDS